MARFITVYAVNDYEGTVAPADARPPWSVTFRGGKAEVPLVLFNDGRFQAYLQRQVLLGRWSLEAPAGDVTVVPASAPIKAAAPKPKATPKKKPAAKKP